MVAEGLIGLSGVTMSMSGIGILAVTDVRLQTVLGAIGMIAAGAWIIGKVVWATSKERTRISNQLTKLADQMEALDLMLQERNLASVTCKAEIHGLVDQLATRLTDHVRGDKDA